MNFYPNHHQNSIHMPVGIEFDTIEVKTPDFQDKIGE